MIGYINWKGDHIIGFDRFNEEKKVMFIKFEQGTENEQKSWSACDHDKNELMIPSREASEDVERFIKTWLRY